MSTFEDHMMGYFNVGLNYEYDSEYNCDLQANPDTPSAQMRNYSLDSRHLVLLKGFALQGRPS